MPEDFRQFEEYMYLIFTDNLISAIVHVKWAQKRAVCRLNNYIALVGVNTLITTGCYSKSAFHDYTD